MKVALILALASTALATSLSSFMITYPDEFPYYDKLVQTVHDLQGTITHEYTLFNGFSVDLPQDTVNTLKSLNDKYKWGLEIEEDQEVHALGGQQPRLL